MKPNPYKKDKLQIQLNNLVNDLKKILTEDRIDWDSSPVVQSRVTPKQAEIHQKRVQSYEKGQEINRKNAVPMPPPINLDNVGAIDIKNKKALVANVVKVVDRTDKLNTIYFETYMEEFENYGTILNERDVFVDEFVVDITKLLNELKKTMELIDKSDVESLEEIRKLTQYFVKTYQDMAQKFVEADKKLAEFKKRYQFLEKESIKKVNEIKNKYKISEMEKEMRLELKKIWKDTKAKSEISGEDYPDWNTFVDAEIEDLKKKGLLDDHIVYQGSDFFTVVEETSKNKIREIRPIIQKLFDIPEQIIKYAKINVTAVGRHFNLSANAPRMKVDKNAFLHLKENFPDAYKSLIDKNMLYWEETKDSVNIARPALVEIKNLFMEFDINIKKLADQVETDIETKKEINEGLMTNIKDAVFKSVYSIFYKYIERINGMAQQFMNKFNKPMRQLDNVNSELTSIESKVRDQARQNYKKLLDMREKKAKLGIDTLKSVKDKL